MDRGCWWAVVHGEGHPTPLLPRTDSRGSLYALHPKHLSSVAFIGSLSSLFFLLIHVCVSRLGGRPSLVFTCTVPIPMAEHELSLGEAHGSQN